MLLRHQIIGLHFLASLYMNNLNGVLADEHGLGKRIQTIAFLVYLLDRHERKGPHLIIASAESIAKWQEELEWSDRLLLPGTLWECF